GSVGVGGSVDTIVLTKSVKSQIRNGSNIDAKGEINLNSTSTDINGIPLDSSGKVVTDGTTSIASYVPSITVGISGSGEAAVQGSDVSRIITNEIESSIKDSIINTTGDVTLNSAEDLTLSSVIASIAGSASASVGASIYTAVISTDVNSFIQGSTFDSTGNVTLNATSSEDIQVGSASIAGAEYAGITGIVNTIVVTNSTNAYIDSTTHTAGKTSGNTLSLKAQDDTEITVMTGQISGAIAGVGGNVDTTVIDKSVKSEIRNGSDIKTTGLLSLDATSSENLNAVAAAIAGGGVGAQGLVSTKVISNTVQSLISGDTTEIEAGSSNIHAKNTTNILGALGAATAGGTAVGATVAVNVINNTVEAYIANKSTDVTGILDIKAEAEENIGKGTITGSDIGMIVVSGAAGGSATTGAVSANIINNSVNAYATSEEHINAGTLNVTASDVAKIHANAGSALVSFGGGGYGASIIPSVITNSVTAYVDGTVNAGDLNINANSTQDLLTLAVGFAGSSDIGLSGSVVTNVIDTQTKAYITDNSHVTASNNIAISATDTSNIDVLAGAGAIGSAGAVGASVIVNVVNKDVEAYVGQSAVVDADNKTSISATAVENIGQKDLGAFIGRNDDKSTKGVYAVAGSLGGMVGVAGTVIVNSINNTVKAAVKPNARLNQNNSATAKAEQSVSLSAKDTTNINAATGAGAAGMVGVGASVNVNVISNTVNSYAGQASQVNAKKDVEIKAESAENLDSKAIAFAGGVVSIAGAISVASIGNNVNPVANNKLSENSSSVNAVNAAQSQTNNALSKGQTSYTGVIGTAKTKATTASSQTQTKASNAISSGTSGTNITVTGNSASADYAAPANYIDSTTSTLQFNDTTRKGATSAFIDSDATVKAGENITVAAKNDNNVSLLTGSATAGAYVSVGASVGVADINTTTEAYINAGATVESDGDTRITSNSTDTSTVKSYAGSGVGIVAANGSVAYLNSNKITRSYTVDDNVSGVSFNNADNLIISATSSTNDTVEAHGASAGIAALGASVAIASGTGTTTATLGKNTKIGKDSEKSVKNLTVSASSTDSVSSKAQGGVVGVVGAGVTYAETSIKPYVTAYINDYADITLDGYMTVEASENVTKATSESYGLNIGGFSVGVSQAITNVGDTSKKTESKIGSNSTINTGGNATVKTTFTTSNVSSSAKTGAYGLVGGNGSLANTNVKNVINSYIADATTLTAGGTLTIQNNVVNSASSKADGRAYGLVAGGYTEAANEINTTSNAYIANNSTAKNINAGNVSIVSNVTNNATANTSAGSGGLASGLGAKSQSKITSNNNAYTGSNLNLNSAGNIGISAATNNNYKSSIDASSYGAIAGGAPQVVNSITSNVNVYTGANSATIAGNNITVDAYNSTRKPDNGYNLYGGSGGVATYGAGEITSSITHTTNTTLNGNLIKSGANTKASAKNDIDITEKADTEAYGGIPKTDTSIEETIRSSATVKAQAANITAGRDISLLAYSNTYAYAKSNVYAGGVAPTASGEATIRNTNSNTIDIPTGTNLFAERNLTLQAGGGNSIINAIVNTNSDGLLWNFGDMDADASQTISNNINIASGSNVKAGEELDLWSLAGYYYADGYYKGKTRFYIVFGIPITKYKYGGDGGTSISNYITLNGNAESGVYNEKTLTLSYEDASDPDSIKTSGEGITMGAEEAVPYSQKELFEDKRDELIKQRNEVLSGDPDSDTSAAGGMNADLATLELTRIHADEAKTKALTAKNAFDDAVADFNTSYAELQAPTDGSKTLQQVQMEAISEFASDNSLAIGEPDGSKPAAEQVAQLKASLDTAINNQKTDLGNNVTSATNAYETADNAVQAQEKAIADYKAGMDARIDYWDTLANSPNAGTAFYYLPVNAVSIGTGLTSIKGNLTGSGKITAPGNVFRIDVQNNTTKSLLFHNLSINKDADGRIFYNGTTYNNDANIGGVTLDIRNPGKNVKEIVINNAYDPDNPHNPLQLNITDTELSGNSGDLYFTGDISNPGGDVRITNMTGSVVTEGQISAKNYFLYVPRGAYIQNFSSGVFNSAGSAGEGSIIAGQDVTIIAQMINVNGLIQSGEADKQITINDFDTPVAYYDGSGKLLGYKVNGVALGEETLSTGDVICDMLTAYITGDSNIKAFWDGEKIQVFRSEIRGGNITLNGEIISTGNGVLKVVSGYGEINVENKSSHDMVINKLSADRKIDGKVILNNREISNTLASKLIDLLQNDKAGYNALMYNDGYFENNVPITSLVPANYIYDEGLFE
ncbi:MAG: hypothetical protein GX638_19355, partial [Crenarchaeota archaeon]|nr:hypothetical protein [Thermoproteota archaeon]